MAAIQSLLNTYFGGYVSGGIAAGQNSIATATGTTTAGTYNTPAINYTNQQLAAHTRTPSDWYYANSSTTSASQLWSRVQYDVGYGWPTYVQVNWNSPYWPDHANSGGPVGHASLGIGWSGSSTLYAYDPRSWVTSSGSCYFGPYYQSSPNYACDAALTSTYYYYATEGGYNIQWY